MLHSPTRQGTSVYVATEATSAKPADPDFGIADLVNEALAVLYESGSGVGQLLRDLISARPFAEAPHRDRVGDVQAATEADQRAASGSRAWGDSRWLHRTHRVSGP